MKMQKPADIQMMQQPQGYGGYQGYGQKPINEQALAAALSAPASAGLALPNGDDASRKRAIADALMARGMDTSAKGLTEGIAQLGQAFIGTRMDKKAQIAEELYNTQMNDLRSAAASGDMQALGLLDPMAAAAMRRDDTRYQREIDWRNAEGKVVNGRLVNPVTGEVIRDYSDPATRETQTDALGRRRYVDTGEIVPGFGDAKPQRGPLVTIGGEGGYRMLADVPSGMPIPPDLLPFPESKYPADTYFIKTDEPPYFRASVTPGSATENKANAANDSTTIDTLINSYATLNSNKAITAHGNSAWENAGAIYSSTPVGKLQDALGGGVGNIDNATARGNIEGLSMNALMKMISMSDVSAKAMDSDAEMKAWLSAIKDDNYESALTKLHVLDSTFGGGRALQDAFERGTISQESYEFVTSRLNSDPYTQDMYQRAQRYASLDQSVGPERLTSNERASAAELDARIAALKAELGQ